LLSGGTNSRVTKSHSEISKPFQAIARLCTEGKPDILFYADTKQWRRTMGEAELTRTDHRAEDAGNARNDAAPSAILSY